MADIDTDKPEPKVFPATQPDWFKMRTKNAPIVEAKDSETRISRWQIFAIIAVTLAVGCFFAIDLDIFKPKAAKIDRTVSKFMLEKPTWLVRMNRDGIRRSPAFSEAFAGQDPNGNPLKWLDWLPPHVRNVTWVTDRMQAEGGTYLAIVNLALDCPEGFISGLDQNFSEDINGTHTAHTTLPVRGLASVCLPEPRTLLFGSPSLVQSVLERDDFPKLTPAESQMVKATDQGQQYSCGFSANLLTDYLPLMLEASKNTGSHSAKSDASSWQLRSFLSITKQICAEADFVNVSVEYTNPMRLRVLADLDDEKQAAEMSEQIEEHLRRLKPDLTNGFKKLQYSGPSTSGSQIEAAITLDPSALLAGGMPFGI